MNTADVKVVVIGDIGDGTTLHEEMMKHSPGVLIIVDDIVDNIINRQSDEYIKQMIELTPCEINMEDMQMFENYRDLEFIDRQVLERKISGKIKLIGFTGHNRSHKYIRIRNNTRIQGRFWWRRKKEKKAR